VLGYWIVISTQPPEQVAALEVVKKTVLANWETGTSGIRWLDALVKEGKATKLRSDGYPNRYVSTAGVVLPLVVPTPPGGKASNAIFKTDEIAACPPDQSLTIEAWDQS
jgi:hypothetical protein